jgi:hypothetical protein
MRKYYTVIRILVILFFLIGIYSFVGCGRPDQSGEIAKALAEFDNHEHSPETFLSIMNDLHDCHPGYSLEKIGDAVARTWNGVKEVESGISAYTVANDLLQLSEENKGADFAEVMASYMIKKAFKLDRK